MIHSWLQKKKKNGENVETEQKYPESELIYCEIAPKGCLMTNILVQQCVNRGQLTWQLLAPPCMNPEQTMFSVKRWG